MPTIYTETSLPSTLRKCPTHNQWIKYRMVGTWPDRMKHRYCELCDSYAELMAKKKQPPEASFPKIKIGGAGHYAKDDSGE